MRALLVCAFVMFSANCVGADVLQIGAFQIDIFGTSKGNKPDVMEVIRKIITDYDIMLIQDIRQASGIIFGQLLTLINSNSTEQFQYVASPRLGRSSSKSQYAYYYKIDRVAILSTLLYNDSAGDVFEREPFSVDIALAGETSSFLVLTGIQVKPSDALAEINGLDVVYNNTMEQFGTDDIIILGNMNADCGGASASQLATTRLFSDTSTFLSLIGNDQDTTVSSSNCAYDRIVVSGTLKSLVSGYRIQIPEDDFGITQALMAEVSNHYPVAVNVTIPPKVKICV